MHYNCYKNGSVLRFAAALVKREGCCDTKTEQVTLHLIDLATSRQDKTLNGILQTARWTQPWSCWVFNEMSLQLSEWEQAWSPHSEGSHKDRPFFLFLKRNFKISVRYLEWSFPLWIWLMVSNCIYKGPTVASSCWPLRFSRTDKGLLICAKQRNSRLETVAAALLQRYNLSGWLTGGRTSVPSCQNCCREESLCLRHVMPPCFNQFLQTGKVSIWLSARLCTFMLVLEINLCWSCFVFSSLISGRLAQVWCKLDRRRKTQHHEIKDKSQVELA